MQQTKILTPRFAPDARAGLGWRRGARRRRGARCQSRLDLLHPSATSPASRTNGAPVATRPRPCRQALRTARSRQLPIMSAMKSPLCAAMWKPTASRAVAFTDDRRIDAARREFPIISRALSRCREESCMIISSALKTQSGERVHRLCACADTTRCCISSALFCFYARLAGAPDAEGRGLSRARRLHPLRSARRNGTAAPRNCLRRKTHCPRGPLHERRLAACRTRGERDLAHLEALVQMSTANQPPDACVSLPSPEGRFDRRRTAVCSALSPTVMVINCACSKLPGLLRDDFGSQACAVCYTPMARKLPHRCFARSTLCIFSPSQSANPLFHQGEIAAVYGGLQIGEIYVL